MAKSLQSMAGSMLPPPAAATLILAAVAKAVGAATSTQAPALYLSSNAYSGKEIRYHGVLECEVALS
jgi:hypothetical protein